MDDEVEIIDLTNESTTKLDTTITLDDSFVAPSYNYLSSPSPEPLPSPKKSPQKVVKSKKTSPAKSVATQVEKRTDKIVRKPAKQTEKQIDKQAEKLAEKLQREANKANAANKAFQNCDCLIDKGLLNLINDSEEITIRTLFDESMVQYRITDYPKLENSVTWVYKRTEVVNNECVTRFKDAKWTIVVMSGEDYLKRLLTYKTDPNDDESLKSFILKLKRCSNTDYILIVYNLAGHLKSERQKEAKNYRDIFKKRFEQGSAVDPQTIPNVIGQTELQNLRLMLELELQHSHDDLKFHIDFYEKTNEVVQALVRYTISVAKLEIKQQTRTATGIDWAINVDKERAIDPTKSNEDLTKLWITQLQQFPQVTLPIAKAITAEYPAPYALIDQYKSLTESECEGLLAELHVQRNLRRQVGLNISKRVYRFMSCQNPDVHIGFN